MCSETKNTNKMFSYIIKPKMQTYLFSSFNRALTEAPLTSTTSKITIMSYRDKIYKKKKTDLTQVQVRGNPNELISIFFFHSVFSFKTTAD